MGDTSEAEGDQAPAPPPWASTGSAIPQVIAHRGFKAAFPENSMAAFKGAVEAGAHALETDVHLTSDGVVVLSHGIVLKDPTLKRCFGIDRRIRDCSWSYISTLTTTLQPAQPMARLDELLAWTASDSPSTWLLLDIKVGQSDPEDLFTRIRGTFDAVPHKLPWNRRIILGCWNATYAQAAMAVLPSFSLSHISLSTAYSRHFLPLSNMGFNISSRIIVGPDGTRFLQDVKALRRPVFVWTVNDEAWMEWFVRENIARPLVDGVVTDDPGLFLRVCASVQGAAAPAESLLWAGMRGVVSALYRLLYGSAWRAAFRFLMWRRGWYDYFPTEDA